jgi:tetratricopeptide (TPR) repeat protein
MDGHRFRLRACGSPPSVMCKIAVWLRGTRGKAWICAKLAASPQTDEVTMRHILIAVIVLASPCLAQEPTHVVGSGNPNLSAGARALLGGRNEEGIRLTLRGLEAARDGKEEEVALSNLCAGYTNLGDYESALRYCDILLERNDKLWRAYNSKALIYIYTKQYDKAEQELLKGEALNPGAHSMKIARALYNDATNPVAPVIEVDDRSIENQ